MARGAFRHTHWFDKLICTWFGGPLFFGGLESAVLIGGIAVQDMILKVCKAMLAKPVQQITLLQLARFAVGAWL